MKSLYSQYIKEREGIETFENEKGFFTYEICSDENVMHICDMYLLPEFRSSGEFKSFLSIISEIAYKNEVEKMLFKVDISTNGSEYIAKVHLKLGMKFYSMNGENELWFHCEPNYIREKYLS